MVCISFISTDVLLLLFAQCCPPLLRRKSDFVLWIHTSIFQKVLLVCFAHLLSPKDLTALRFVSIVLTTKF